MIRQIKIENDVVQSVVTSKLQLKGYVENDDLTVVIGSRLVNGEFVAPEVDLEELKSNLVARVKLKTGALITYLAQKYAQSNELGVIADIKNELDYLKLHKSDYEAVAGTEDEEAYLQEFYPITYTYMKVKGRTFLEQIAVAKDKRGLTALVASKTEALLSTITKIETKEEFEVLDAEVKEIESLGTVKEFMQYMGRNDGQEE